jgi:hypothetical protein
MRDHIGTTGSALLQLHLKADIRANFQPSATRLSPTPPSAKIGLIELVCTSSRSQWVISSVSIIISG